MRACLELRPPTESDVDEGTSQPDELVSRGAKLTRDSIGMAVDWHFQKLVIRRIVASDDTFGNGPRKRGCAPAVASAFSDQFRAPAHLLSTICLLIERRSHVARRSAPSASEHGMNIDYVSTFGG